MPALTPSFLFDLESNMKLIQAREYQRLVSNLWWNKLAKLMPSQAKKERITWLLDTAKIERRADGQAVFEDIVSQTTEYENESAVGGLEVTKPQIEDLDGNGVQLATHWSRQIGAYAAYWPQKMVAQAILANPVTYDALPFFDLAHPYNPFKTSLGTYANRLTGAVDGIYPGACPIHAGSTTVEEAIANIAKALAYAAAYKMPNGEDPRFMRLRYIFHPPALTSRVTQITSAKFIAQVAGGGAGSGDVEAMIRKFGFGEPVECPELGSAFGGSDTSYYLGMEEITSDELGAFAYVDREAFNVTFHGPQTSAELARMRKLQWLTNGRNTVGPGHPYLLIRGEAT
jgi:hypothetical protein